MSITIVVHLVILQRHTHYTDHMHHKILNVNATINLPNLNTVYTNRTTKHRHKMLINQPYRWKEQKSPTTTSTANYTHPLGNTTEKRYLCRRRLLSGSPPLICRTMPPLPVALPDNDPPPPPTQMVAGTIHFPPCLSWLSHFETTPALVSPFCLFTFWLRRPRFPLLSLKFSFSPAKWLPETLNPLHPQHHRLTFDLLSPHSQTAQQARLTSPPFSLKFLSLLLDI